MLVITLALGFFLVWPKFQDFQQLQGELEQKEVELDSKTAYYSEIKKIQDRLEGYQDSLLQIENAVSKSYSLPVIFNYLQVLSGQTGLILEDLTFGGVSGQDLQEISFNLKVSGSYSSFNSFLSALESSARLFNVKSIHFSYPEGGRKAFSFDITVATYSY